ncbi:MAG: HEAT repeat domain-containing protein [Candidatus Riflebacteria bacterium]|nr:HEAT repeat domain-containing protein [Candidatus Riflebacteria bacterium]
MTENKIAKSILEELDAPVRSFRLYAIEKIIRESNSPEIIDLLKKRKSVEDDSECLVMLEHAIAIICERIKGSDITENLSDKDFLEKFYQAENNEKLLLLSSLKTNRVKSLAEIALKLLNPDGDMSINLAVVRTFGNFFPNAFLKDLLLYLRCNHLFMRLAVLELLVSKAPDVLKRDLPRFLIHQDPRIRSLAIRGLAQIDLEEALRHLELLLETSDPNVVIAALQISLFLPFDRVKPIFLKTLSLAQDPDILSRIGIFIENNPDLEVPFRIWELLEKTSGTKREILQEILQNSCRNIEKAQILGNDYQKYFETLKKWIKKRGAVQWVRELISSLDNEEIEFIKENFQINEKLKNLLLRETLQEALKWSISSKASSAIQDFLLSKDIDSEPQEKVEKSEGNIQKNAEENFTNKTSEASSETEPRRTGSFEIDFPELVHEEKIRNIAGLSADLFKKHKAFLQKISLDKHEHSDIHAIILKTAKRFEDNGYVDCARQNFKSRTPQLAQAAVEYLGEFDFDWFFPFLGSILQSENIRIKSAAIKVLTKVDLKQSISAIRTMLFKQNQESAEKALACLIHFDFIAVRQLLFEFIKNCTSDKLFEAALFFFKANPDPENLFLLAQLEKKLLINNQITFSQTIVQTRRENFEFLKSTQQIPSINWENSESSLKMRLLEDEESKRKTPAPYSVKALTKEAPETDFSQYIKQAASEIYYLAADSFSKYPKFSFGSILIIAAMYFYAITPASITPAQKTIGSQVFSSLLTTEGNVVQSETGGIILNAQDGKTYLLQPAAGTLFAKYNPGTKIKVNCVPFRITENGSIRAQCINLNVIK